MSPRPGSGFTLIELSIVLVIIGLLVGGVLLGRDLIEVSKIRRQASQLQEISTAYNVFRLKFNAIPGDLCKNAPSFGLACGNAAGYRDNGVIDDIIIATGPLQFLAYEPVYFMPHLVDAGLLPANPAISCPSWGPSVKASGLYANAINPSTAMIAAPYRGEVAMFLGINLPTCVLNRINLSSDGGVMSPAQAMGIDTKIDDGIPNSGSFIATTLTAAPPSISGAVDTAAGQCVADVSATMYDIANGNNVCRILAVLH